MWQDYVQITRKGVSELAKKVSNTVWGYGFCKTDNDFLLIELRKAAELLRDQELEGNICLCSDEADNIKALIHKVLGPECGVSVKDFTKESNPDADRWLLQNPYCLSYEYTYQYLRTLCSRVGIDFKIVEKKCASVGIDLKITDKVVCDAIDLALDIQEHLCDFDVALDIDIQQCIVDLETIVSKTGCDIDLKTYVEKISCGATVETILSELDCSAEVDVEIGDAVNCPASSSVSPSSSSSPSVSPSSSLSLSLSPSASVSSSPSPSAVLNGNITGTVKDEFGNALSGVNLKLYADADLDGVADNATVIRNVFTTGSGTWSMVNLTPGSYVVVAQAFANYTIVSGIDITNDGDSVANIPTSDNIIPVTIGSGEIDSGNNFVYTADTGTISGTVFDDLGNPISGAEIKIYEDNNFDGVSDGVLVSTVTTNGSGVYTATGIPSGPFGLASGDRSYVIVLTVPALYQIVSGIDNSDDADTVVDADGTDNIIPCTLTVAEVDANNDFIIELI